MEPRSTTDLLDAWYHGDQDALAELIQRYEDWLRRFVRRKLSPGIRTRAESGDIVQDVLLKFLRKGPRFCPRSELEFKALIARAVVNRISDIYDQVTGPEQDVGLERRLPTAISRIGISAGSTDRPARRVELEEERSFVSLALSLVDPDVRRIINLREWRGHDFPRIANLLGITPDAARMRFNYALYQLREQVQKLRLGHTDDLMSYLD